MAAMAVLLSSAMFSVINVGEPHAHSALTIGGGSTTVPSSAPSATSTASYDYQVANNVVKSASGSTVYTASSFTAALNWAMDQAGKKTYIPAGTYTLTSYVTPVSGTTLLGAGSGATGTVLKFTATTFQASRIWYNGVSDVTLSNIRILGGGVNVQSTAKTCYNILLQDVTFYQTPSRMPASFWTYTASKGVIDGVALYRCQAIETGCMGFLLSGDISGSDTTARTNGGWTKNVYFEDCSAIWCGKNGQHNAYVCGFDLNEGTNSRNVYLKNCMANYNWMDGFHCEMWPYSLNVVYDHCSASYNGQKGSGYGFIYRTEAGWHETALTSCTGIGNKGGDANCVTTHVITNLPSP